MRPKIKKESSVESVIQYVFDITDEFIKNTEEHCLAGLKRFVNDRRKLIALIDDRKEPGIGRIRSSQLMQKLWEQDNALAKISSEVKNELAKSISLLKRSTVLMRNFNPHNEKRSKFFDRKS